MKKTNRELSLEVRAANDELKRKREHRFDGLFTVIGDTFNILKSKYGWGMEEFRAFYPESTIKVAACQGWISPEDDKVISRAMSILGKRKSPAKAAAARANSAKRKKCRGWPKGRKRK